MAPSLAEVEVRWDGNPIDGSGKDEGATRGIGFEQGVMLMMARWDGCEMVTTAERAHVVAWSIKFL